MYCDLINSKILVSPHIASCYLTCKLLFVYSLTESHYIAQVGLVLLTLLSGLSKCWDYGSVLPHVIDVFVLLFFSVLVLTFYHVIFQTFIKAEH